LVVAPVVCSPEQRFGSEVSPVLSVARLGELP
jgi:hypothetical protein